MKPINYLDGFSGYGGFHLALKNTGYEFNKCYYSEIDKYAIANYKYNFPESIYAGSITDIPTNGIIEGLDLFTFGWPCQDNSRAGKGAGQRTGTRSGLLYSAVEVINKYKPRVFIAENVEGLYVVNKGIDIIESFRILSIISEDCPQYDIEMQFLNSCWFGVQNRPRLYFVGHRRGGGTTTIFPITENITQDNKRGILANTEKRIRNLFNLSMPYEERRNISDRFYFRNATPLEYERIQGLPDGWTSKGNYQDGVGDIPEKKRYELCGNGVHIPTIKAITEKLRPNFI